MTSSGNNIKNGNGKSAVYWDITKESGGLFVAELVSMAASLGVVAVADDLAPHLLKNASKTVGKILEPYLDTIENGLQTVCKLEECQPDLTQPREKRAETLAHTLIVFSTAFVASMAAKIATRKVMNRVLHVEQVPTVVTGNRVKDFLHKYIIPNKHDRHIFYWDEGVHLGSLLLLNTGMAKHTDHAIQGASNILQKQLGWSKKRADNVAQMGVIWEVPNALGWLAGAGVIAHDKLKTHAERLAHSSALSSSLHTR